MPESIRNSAGLLLLAWACAASAQAPLDARPAARVHVRCDGIGCMRHTSKLSQVVELNFTFGFDHVAGKRAISALLTRIANDYSTGSSPAFTIKRFVGPGSGGSNGLPNPEFSLEDLLAADVIVTNNVSLLTRLPIVSAPAAAAFAGAVRGGKGVIGVHGSGELWDGGWDFVDREFFPWTFEGHGSRTPMPVYKNGPEAKHLVLAGVLDSGTVPREVQMGVDSAGTEVLVPGVPTRNIYNEMLRFTRNPLADPEYAPLTTCLLRYDYRSVSPGDLPNTYRYKGGNAYSCILKVGLGKSVYLPAGHDESELERGSYSFDGGTGDLERYFAHMLSFLAGYRSEPCGAAVECAGLPVVDSLDHLTGERYPDAGAAVFHPREPAFRVPANAPYRAVLTDLRGRVAAARTGRGSAAPIVFDRSGLPPGVYILSVRVGAGPPQARRYGVAP